MAVYTMEDFEAQRWFDAHRGEFIEDISRLVQIKSISSRGEGGYPFGTGCAHALQHILERAEQMGFTPENHENYCGSILLPGETEKEIGIFVHLDVVPEGEGWTFDPYGGALWNGFVVGRGSADNKGSVICALYLLRCLKEKNIRFHHGIRLFFGCDEEAGMRDIEYFLEKHSAPVFGFAADAPFGVCHGERGALSAVFCRSVPGKVLVDFKAGTAVNVIPNRAEAVLCGKDVKSVRMALPEAFEVIQDERGVRVTAFGRSVHGANPGGSVNAAAVLAQGLAVSGLLPVEEGSVMGLLSRTFADYEGMGIGVSFEDQVSGRLTHSGGLVCMTDRKLRFSVNIRYPVTTDRALLHAELDRYCAENRLTMEELHDSAPSYIPADDPIVDYLYETAVDVLNPKLTKYILGGGTYGRKLPRGVSYGPGVRPRYSPFEEGRGMGHQPDECVEINVLRNGFRVYCQALPGLDNLLKREEGESTL